MVTMVDPPGGWAYGFPAPLQGDYEKQLREAGYPESDIPLALAHSWYHDEPDDLVGVGPVYPAPAPDAKETFKTIERLQRELLILCGVDLAKPGGDHTAYTESYMDPETGKVTVHRIETVDTFTGTASDGDDGA